jgi:hypothetical protein
MNPDNTDRVAMDQQASLQAASEIAINASPPDGRGHDANTEELPYEPVPAPKAVTVSVRYRVRHRGRPLPYPLDKGAGE